MIIQDQNTLLNKTTTLGIPPEYIRNLVPSCLAVQTCYVHRNVAVVIFFFILCLFFKSAFAYNLVRRLIRKLMVVLLIFQNIIFTVSKIVLSTNLHKQCLVRDVS